MVDGGYFLCQGTVGGRKGSNSLAVVGSGGGQIGDGINGLLFVGSICGLVTGTSGGGTRLTELSMREGKITFEMLPSFVRRELLFPDLAVIGKHPCCE